MVYCHTVPFRFVKKTTTGYACGIKKAMPMSRNDKPPTIQ